MYGRQKAEGRIQNEDKAKNDERLTAVPQLG